MSTLKGRLSAAVILITSSTTSHAQTTASPDIVVTATRTPQPIQRAGSAITVITAEDIERASISPTRSLADVLRQVPGVTLTQAGGPGQAQFVRIRGGDVRHTLVLIDGIRVNDPSTTGRELDFATLVPANIERIEVLRGPQSALYGSDAMGGVINIITKRGRGAPKATLAVEAGSYDTKEVRGGVSGGNEIVDYSLGFTGLDTDGFSAIGYRIKRLRGLSPFGLEDDGARRLGLTGRVGIKVADDVRLEVGGSTNYNRAEYDYQLLPLFDTPSVASAQLHNGYARLIADSFGGLLRSTVTTFANQTDRRFDDVSTGQGGVFCNGRFIFAADVATCRAKFDFLGERAGAEYQGDLSLGSFGLLTFGARGEQERALTGSREIVPSPSLRTTDIKAEQSTGSVFALHQITLGERLHLSVGGRIDDVENVHRFGTWRATAAYEIFETNTKFRASAGTGAKAPALFQLFSPLFGNTGLEPERSFGFDVGIDQMLLDGALKLSPTVFYNRYRNLIDFQSPDFSAFPTVAPPGCSPSQVNGCFFNVAEAETSGLELAAEIRLVPQFLRLKATYTHLRAVGRSRDTVTDTLGPMLRLARRPSDEGRIGLVFTPIAGLSIEPTVVLVSERFSSNNELNRLEPYARLDMYADYKINDTFSIFGRAENLTNTRYEEVFNFGTAGRSFYGGVRATW